MIFGLHFQEDNFVESNKALLSKLENVSQKSNILAIEQGNIERKKYIVEKESEIINLEKNIKNRKDDIIKATSRAHQMFTDSISKIHQQSIDEQKEKATLITLESFYKRYILSKKDFWDLIKSNIHIKFEMEKLESLKDNKDIVLKYQEQNKIISEFNQIFKAKKLKMENKIENLICISDSPSKNKELNIIDGGNFNELNNIKISLENLFESYPNLFHKQILGISQSKISYDVVKYSKAKKEHVAHLHCFNLDYFDQYYGPYFSMIQKYFYVIITYSFGSPSKIKNQDATILKAKNKGMDIGGKISCLHFLETNKIAYNIIFFLHSKTNMKKRMSYFSPFVKNEQNLSNLISKLKNSKTLGAIFPNCIHSLKKDPEEYIHLQRNNKDYLNDLSKILKIKKDNPIIFEGNVFMIKKSVLTPIINNMELLYSLLNDESSFDYNWFKIYNKLGDNISVNEAFKLLRIGASKINVGNNIPLMLQTHITSLPDGMIEHTIERIWEGLLIKEKKEYMIVS